MEWVKNCLLQLGKSYAVPELCSCTGCRLYLYPIHVGELVVWAPQRLKVTMSWAAHLPMIGLSHSWSGIRAGVGFTVQVPSFWNDSLTWWLIASFLSSYPLRLARPYRADGDGVVCPLMMRYQCPCPRWRASCCLQAAAPSLATVAASPALRSWVTADGSGESRVHTAATEPRAPDGWHWVETLRACTARL